MLDHVHANNDVNQSGGQRADRLNVNTWGRETFIEVLAHDGCCGPRENVEAVSQATAEMETGRTLNAGCEPLVPAALTCATPRFDGEIATLLNRPYARG